jgi:uncharacterized protein YndB with AHSA1/START domain
MEPTMLTSTMTTPTDRTMHIERVFNAPRDCVWRATTEPDLVAQWWGRGHVVDVEKLEVEPGGHWRFVEHSPDGSLQGFEGRYGEVRWPELAVQTFEWDGLPGHPSLQAARFEELEAGRTKLSVDVTFFSTEERDGMMGSGMKEGMDQSYAALDALLAKIC